MQARIRLVYSKDYAINIGDHVFPTSKYSLIKERLTKESAFKDRLEFVTPVPARDEDVLLAHDRAYFEKLKNASLSKEELLRLELPYSKAVVYSSLVCCGGTTLASEIALSDGLGIHVGGGFHHAFQDHGEGFCVLNDIAVAVKKLVRDKKIEKALVIDCDLHQGNGTAAIFRKDPAVFTFSIHQENNYPFLKPPSNLDVGLRDHAGDREYLEALREHVPKIVSDFKPSFIMYVAGADPYKEDRIGALALTKDGLKKRDEFVFRQAVSYSVPLAIVLAGGYASKEEDTVNIHYNTIETALRLYYGK